jgi:hypothetical protein
MSREAFERDESNDYSLFHGYNTVSAWMWMEEQEPSKDKLEK